MSLEDGGAGQLHFKAEQARPGCGLDGEAEGGVWRERGCLDPIGERSGGRHFRIHCKALA